MGFGYQLQTLFWQNIFNIVHKIFSFTILLVVSPFLLFLRALILQSFILLCYFALPFLGLSVEFWQLLCNVNSRGDFMIALFALTLFQQILFLVRSFGLGSSQFGRNRFILINDRLRKLNILSVLVLLPVTMSLLAVVVGVHVSYLPC